MGNTYFQFKHFKIEQSGAAMKVCTDSCLLGAYASHPSPKKILDIGTGTGLLSLMLAQKYPEATVTALEPHQQSYRQALNNFENSQWSKNFQLLPVRLQDFLYSTVEKYELLICNPPFYPAQRSKPELNQAAHSFTLPASEIVKAMLRLLAINGLAYILYPPGQSTTFESMAISAGLNKQENLCIKNSEMVNCFRIISTWNKQSSLSGEKEFVIHRNGKYSPEFVELMKDYYLFL